jgi:hypothetical protein
MRFGGGLARSAGRPRPPQHAWHHACHALIAHQCAARRSDTAACAAGEVKGAALGHALKTEQVVWNNTRQTDHYPAACLLLLPCCGSVVPLPFLLPPPVVPSVGWRVAIRSASTTQHRAPSLARPPIARHVLYPTLAPVRLPVRPRPLTLSSKMLYGWRDRRARRSVG